MSFQLKVSDELTRVENKKSRTLCATGFIEVPVSPDPDG